MRSPSRPRYLLAIAAGALALAGAAAGFSPAARASAAATRSEPVQRSSAIAGGLYGVAVRSASSAWAVGSYAAGRTSKTLILRWNGISWARTPSPSPGTGDQLNAVTFGSAGSAWAVGSTKYR